MPRLSPEGYESEIRDLRDQLYRLQYQNGSASLRAGAEAMLNLLVGRARSRTDAAVSEAFMEAQRYDLIAEAVMRAK